VPAWSVVSFSGTVQRLKRFIAGRGESADQKKTQTISPNCSMTHSPGKIEYNCRYFLMTFRKRIRKNKFSKNDFHTLQGTMSHRPLTNTSSLKITAAYSTSMPCLLFLLLPCSAHYASTSMPCLLCLLLPYPACYASVFMPFICTSYDTIANT
jgi:hypothetical protein